MRDVTLTNLDAAAAAAGQDEAAAFVMDEEQFRVFYDRTSRPLWAYLSRLTGDRQLADDLLQETYYRFLRARRDYESDAHRQNVLYRIATNLTRDAYRRAQHRTAVALGDGDGPADRRDAQDVADRAGTRTDVGRALARLRPRERQLLWLAYAQGWSHAEIAGILGLKAGSIRQMLWRARQRIIGLLEGTPGSPDRGQS